MNTNFTTKSGTGRATSKSNSERYNHNQTSLIKAADELAAEILQRSLSGNPEP